MDSDSFKWDRRFLQLAKHIAEWSKDPSTKCGAVIVDGNRRIVGVGYNGFPRGVEDDEWRYTDRSIKYSLTVHAETNAIAKLARSNESGMDATMFVTHSPCLDCAKLIYQSGINHVLYRNSYRSEDGINFLKKAGVQVEQI